MGFTRETERPLDMPVALYFGLIAGTAVFSLLLIGLFYSRLDEWIGLGLDFFFPWESRGSLDEGVARVWPIYVWAAGMTLLVGLIEIARRQPRDYEPGYLFVKGTFVSLCAGFFEEVLYRWLAFFAALSFIKFMNILTFGLFEWAYTTFLIPAANWVTFGILEPQLYGPSGWLFAAAVLSANYNFQEGHKYLGFFGWVNSWFIGMVMFFLVFNYGLWAAIVAHVVYDFCVFWTAAATSAFQPRNRYQRLAEAILGRG